MKPEIIFMIGMFLITVSILRLKGVEYNRDVEFAKAGLVQKLDNNKIIWVKPYKNDL